jgi:RNA polymerase sigma factor (sigma-70 family)
VNETLHPAILDQSQTPDVEVETDLRALYARHWAELCNYLKKRFGAGPPDPEDVAQEAFVKYSAAINRDHIDNARAYLYRTAHNLLIDEHRRVAVQDAAKRSAETLGGYDERTPERILVGMEQLSVMTNCLRGMPEARRRSFLLNRLQGMSCAAIARMSDYSESAVKKHILLAMLDLEAALTESERGRR